MEVSSIRFVFKTTGFICLHFKFHLISVMFGDGRTLALYWKITKLLQRYSLPST